MNSTISDKQLDVDISIDDEFYIPFWILLPFLDTAPPDPFINVKVINKKWNNGTSPDGPVEILCCDLLCPKNVLANDIPASYLIRPEDLSHWASRIADWFKEYAN